MHFEETSLMACGSSTTAIANLHFEEKKKDFDLEAESYKSPLP